MAPALSARAPCAAPRVLLQRSRAARPAPRASPRVCAAFEWHAGRVRTSAPAAEGLCSLSLEVPAGVAAGYRVPGQYVQVRVTEADKPAFIALASVVGSSSLDLLIKASPSTEALCALQPGAALQVSDVQGKGFSVAALPAAVSHVLVFATGSGLSPIRALLDTPAAQGGLAGRSGVVHLFYGARSAAHVAFAERLEAWERAGVTVTRVYSGDGGKYVQDVFGAGGKLDGAHTAAVLVGQKTMAEALTAALTAAGVPRERILSNF